MTETTPTFKKSMIEELRADNDRLTEELEDYKGFVLEFEERVKKGLPIDLSLMREMARKYNTPILG